MQQAGITTFGILRNNFPSLPFNLGSCPESRFILLSHLAGTRKFNGKSLYLAEIKVVDACVQFPGSLKSFQCSVDRHRWTQQELDEEGNRKGWRARDNLKPFIASLHPLLLVNLHLNSQCFRKRKNNFKKPLLLGILLLAPQVLSKWRQTSVPGLCLFNFVCTPAGTVGAHSVWTYYSINAW